MENGIQHIGFGIMGGMNQPLAHAQFVSERRRKSTKK
jgi:gamma-glutamyltranspeptidase/glutathione hydrolase